MLSKEATRKGMPSVSSPTFDFTLSVVVYRDYGTPVAMIESLMRNTAASVSYRLYVVDNSAVTTRDPLFAKREAFVSYLSLLDSVEYVDAEKNLGFGGANNLALAMAKSSYHVFVNPDVLFVEDALSEIKAFMDEEPSIGMCVPRINDVAGNLQYVYRRGITVLDAFNRMVLNNAMQKRDRYHAMKDMDYSCPFDVPFAQGSFLVGRTLLLKELGGFDDSFFMYLEDADLCRRLNNVSRLSYCPAATVVHRWERGSHKNLHLFCEHLKSYVHYFRKWGLKIV